MVSICDLGEYDNILYENGTINVLISFVNQDRKTSEELNKFYDKEKSTYMINITKIGFDKNKMLELFLISQLLTNYSINLE